MRLEIPVPRSILVIQRDVDRTYYATPTPNLSTRSPNREKPRVNGPPAPRNRRLHARFSFANRLGGPTFAAIVAGVLIGCGTGLTGPAKPGTSPLTLPAAIQCAGDGLATQDLAGQCRLVPTTMGALEATDSSGLGATSYLAISVGPPMPGHAN